MQSISPAGFDTVEQKSGVYFNQSDDVQNISNDISIEISGNLKNRNP